MVQALSPRGRSLKHELIREYVRELVSEQDPGSPAPSERELVGRFGVARMTVRQAMDALVLEGLLERVPGRGTFVATPRRVCSPVLSFTEEMRRRGQRADSHTILVRREQAGPGVARALGITEGDAVIHWRRLRRGDGAPVCVEDAYLNEVLLPGFLHGRDQPSSLYDELRDRGLHPTWVEDAVTADLAGKDEATALEIPVGAPVLHTQRRAVSGDKVISVSRSVYRGDRYSVRYQLGGH